LDEHTPISLATPTQGADGPDSPQTGAAAPARRGRGRARATALQDGSAAPARGTGRLRMAAGTAAGRRRVFCPWCGTQGTTEWKYCTQCGRPMPRLAPGRRVAAPARARAEAAGRAEGEAELPAFDRRILRAPGLSTSEKVRRLAAQGLTTSQIAKVLGIRYQMAYNVLDRARRRGTQG
jgi:hypothetical protein